MQNFTNDIICIGIRISLGYGRMEEIDDPIPLRELHY